MKIFEAFLLSAIGLSLLSLQSRADECQWAGSPSTKAVSAVRGSALSFTVRSECIGDKSGAGQNPYISNICGGVVQCGAVQKIAICKSRELGYPLCPTADECLKMGMQEGVSPRPSISSQPGKTSGYDLDIAKLSVKTGPHQTEVVCMGLGDQDGKVGSTIASCVAPSGTCPSFKKCLDDSCVYFSGDQPSAPYSKIGSGSTDQKHGGTNVRPAQ